MSEISARRAIYHIKATFGFNKNQIAKITRCTRMLLTLQEGNNVVTDELRTLYEQSVAAKARYGTDLAKHHSNTLVRRKTIAQHFVSKTPDIEAVLAEAHEKSKNIRTRKVKTDPFRMYLRTASVRGRNL
tara:strand:+ start:102131 stop:102520 length:390 start_codon:yes stop_codon:yes gene_type:complete